jgi:hypothetical protein
MNVLIETVTQMLGDVYRAKGAPEDAIDWLVELSLEQDRPGRWVSRGYLRRTRRYFSRDL